METSEEVAAVGSRPSQGALVHGFFVEGARWNSCGQVTTLTFHTRSTVDSEGNYTMDMREVSTTGGLCLTHISLKPTVITSRKKGFKRFHSI